MDNKILFNRILDKVVKSYPDKARTTEVKLRGLLDKDTTMLVEIVVLVDKRILFLGTITYNPATWEQDAYDFIVNCFLKDAINFKLQKMVESIRSENRLYKEYQETTEGFELQPE